VTDSKGQIFQKLHAFYLSIKFPNFTKAEANYSVNKSWLLIAISWQPNALHYFFFLANTFQLMIFTLLSPLVFLFLFYYYK